MNDSNTADVPENEHIQQCEMPECLNDVPKSKGICDECALGR